MTEYSSGSGEKSFISKPQTPYENQKPTLCLIGTSGRSLEDGYAHVFQSSPYLDRFVDYSVDTASNSSFYRIANSVDLSSFDLCVLECSVYDGNQLKAGTTTPALIRATISDIIKKALRQNSLPAILILPVLSCFQSKDHEVRDIYLSIATEYCLPVFDGYRYLQNFKNQAVSVAEFFKDDLHLTREAVSRLAETFLNGLLVAHRISRFRLRRADSDKMTISSSFVISDAVGEFGLAAKLRDAQRWNRPIYLYNNLDHFLQRKSTPSGIYTIMILGSFFDFLVENRNAPTTIVVFHAAATERANMKLPIFAGQRLAGATANVILISDPSLYMHRNLPLAWFAGRQGCPIQDIMTLAIESLNTGLGKARLIFTGPSGGGFAALYYSYRFPFSLSVPSNPQTIIENFGWSAVRMYCKICFGADDDDAARIVLRDRITSDLTRIYAQGCSNFIIYCQNDSDDHVDLHEKPFLGALPDRDIGHIAVVHGKWGKGHVAPPADGWSRLLSDAVNWQGDWLRFVAEADFTYLGEVYRRTPITEGW